MSEHSGGARPPAEPLDPLAALCAAHGPVGSAGHFLPGARFGDWRLTAFIGRGGNGEVYCAEHVSLGTPAAVKVLVREDERAKARFAREAKLLSELKSSSFPRFFAYGEANGCPYLAMELLEPGELPSGDRAIARFMLKVCDAVAELHAQGFVHRDIKPSNILWRTGGSRSASCDRFAARASPSGNPIASRRANSVASAVPVLADLGLAKKLSSPTDAPTLRASASLRETNPTIGGVGTPGYGAPEQMERGEATAASDIHALGVLADRCFDGKPPRAWKRIVERATSSIPERRYPSVAALAGAIRRRHLPRTMTVLSCVAVAMLAAGASMREPAARLWTQWREWRNAPVLDAIASIDGVEAGDARWFLDDLPVDMPYHFVRLPRGKQDWMQRRLCAVVRRNGKTYSAKRTDIIPKKWTGVRKLSLALKENPPDGTVVNVYAQDGTPFEFAWCEPNDAANNRAGFWISTKRLSGKQFESIIKANPHLGSRAFHPFRHDSDSEFPATFGFLSGNTVPDVLLDGYDFRLEPPDFRQWRLGKRLYADFYAEMPEWAGVPPSQKDDERANGGWMRMDGTGHEEYIDNFGWTESQRLTPACVRYLGVSSFWHETNTVAYSIATSLLHSGKPSDVAQGEAMMKGFFHSDDQALKMKAMELCLKRGLSTLDDLGGTNADVRLRFAAARCGDTNVIERLAVGDPDPDVRKEAYGRMANPPPMVSARYISQISAEDDPGDIAKPLKAISTITDRDALEFLVDHCQLELFAIEARNRLHAIGSK